MPATLARDDLSAPTPEARSGTIVAGPGLAQDPAAATGSGQVLAIPPGQHLVANPRLEVSPLDADAAEPMAVCELGVAGGRPVRYSMPIAVVELIDLFDGRRSLEEVIAAYGVRRPGRYSVEKIERLVSDVLLRKGLILGPGGPPTEARRSPDRRRSFLYFQLPLLSARLVEPVAQALRWAYTRPVLLSWLPLFVLLHWVFYVKLLPLRALDVNRLELGDVLLLMLLSTAGTFVHELGHASAAAFYGCKRLEIGWGMYLIFTVLYADVSDVWKLPRRQRAVVDLGGIYFQSVFLALLLALFVRSGNDVYLFAFLFTDLAIASALNPFLRLDGYWLMSDLFGIVNLRQQSLAYLRRVAAAVAGRRPAHSPGPQLSRRATAALALYSVAGIGFFLITAKIVVAQVLVRILVGLPEVLARFWLDCETGAGAVQIAARVGEILWRGLMVAGVALMLFNVLVRLARALQHRRQRTLARGPSGAA